MACNDSNDSWLWSGLFLRGVLISFSQIFLQNNALTGCIFIVAVALYSPVMAAAAILGCCVSQLCALMLCQCEYKQRFNQADPQWMLESGVYGFNGALVGLAVNSLWPLSWLALMLLVVAAVLTSIGVLFCLSRFNSTLYTTPFIVSLWSGWLLFSPHPDVPAVVAAASFAEAEVDGVVAGLLQSALSAIGQVMFLNSSVSGALLLAGLFVASRVAAVFSCIAVILSILIAMLSGLPEVQIESGIYSYNAVLVAVALCSQGDRNLVRLICRVFCGVCLAVLLTRLLQLFDVIPLTAPFVMSIWLIVFFTARKRGAETAPLR